MAGDPDWSKISWLMSETLHTLDGQILAAFDVETTGLSAFYGDRICEVGLVRVQGDEILPQLTRPW